MEYDRTSCVIGSNTSEPINVFFKLCPQIKNIFQFNENKLKIIYSSVKVLVYQRNDIECAWRVHDEVLSSLKTHISPKRIII